MKQFIGFFLIILFPNIISAQQVITLSECYNDALETHPLSQEKQKQNQIWQLNDKNLAAGWYPTMDANVNLIYNSDVVDMGTAFEASPIPGLAESMPLMPHDQYKLSLDINQVIYDGGVIRSNRDLEAASLRIKEQEVEIQLYKVKEQVNNAYFSLLMLNKQKELLGSYFEIVDSRIKPVESAIANGVLLPSDRDILRAEKVRLEQQINESDIRIKSLVSILSGLTSKELLSTVEPVLPDISIDNTTELNRPELISFDLKQEQLEANRALVNSSRMPKAFGFATAGYGKPPGQDFFNESFGTYFIIGAGIKWNIFDWNKKNRQDQIIDVNKSIISSRKVDLEDELRRILESKYAEILSYESMMDTDLELINIRKSVTEAADSQFRNGTITATDYLVELNAEKNAVLNYEIHRISLERVKVDYLNISGNDIQE